MIRKDACLVVLIRNQDEKFLCFAGPGIFKKEL